MQMQHSDEAMYRHTVSNHETEYVLTSLPTYLHILHFIKIAN